MEAYATSVRLTTTVIAVVGVVSHLIVGYLSRKKGKNDHSAYILLVQIYSFSVALRVFSGWIVLNRAQPMSNGTTILFSYGLGGLVKPAYTSAAISLSAYLGFFTVVLIPICMGARALILFNKIVTKKMVLLVTGTFFAVSAPLFVVIAIIMINSPAEAVTGKYYIESIVAPPFVQIEDWVIQVIYAGSNSTYVCVPVTFLLRYVMVKRLREMAEAFSARVSRLHKSFVTLLTFEASVLLIGIAVTLLRQIIKADILTLPLAGTLLSAFSFPILLTMPTIQGVATLLLVPYLRRAVLRPFARSNMVSVFDITSSHAKHSPVTL